MEAEVGISSNERPEEANPTEAEAAEKIEEKEIAESEEVLDVINFSSSLYMLWTLGAHVICTRVICVLENKEPKLSTIIT